MKLFPAVLTLFLVLGVGPTLLIALFAVPYHSQLGTYRLVVSVLLVLSVVSTLCLAGLVTRLLKQPINQLLEAQKQVRHGNLSYRLPAKGNPELNLLFGGFNKMAEG
ncbi:MAG: HAMP domain-containing protein, partial [Deltaproteobacteria bacterium]|nr:HAMP domain-containing protein [Deltaproteobacteria bacterium]